MLLTYSLSECCSVFRLHHICDYGVVTLQVMFTMALAFLRGIWEQSFCLPHILSRFRIAWREECSSYQQHSLYDESWKRTHIRLEIFSDVSSTRKPSTRPALIQFSKRTRSRHTPLTWCECFCLACATVRKGIFFKFHEFQNISNCFLIF